MKKEKKSPNIISNVRAYLVDHKKHTVIRLEDIKDLKPVAETHNLDMYAGYDVIGRAMAGYSNYYINYFYFEYVNVAAIPVPAVPSFNRTAGIEYYTGLGANQDYLRVPISITPNLQATSSSYDNNQVEFFATSSGFTAGEGGTAFTAAQQSTVNGIALVCSPDTSDSSQDIVCARAYFDPGDEILLIANQNIGITHTTQYTA